MANSGYLQLNKCITIKGDNALCPRNWKVLWIHLLLCHPMCSQGQNKSFSCLYLAAKVTYFKAHEVHSTLIGKKKTFLLFQESLAKLMLKAYNNLRTCASIWKSTIPEFKWLTESLGEPTIWNLMHSFLHL